MTQRLFKRTSRVKVVLRALARHACNLLENNNDCQFATNGERHFLDAMLATYAAAEIGPTKGTLHMLDVGANVGDYSRIVLDTSSSLRLRVHLHLFEPLASNFATLQTRLGGFSNVTLNRVAASSTEGDAPIYFDPDHVGLTSLYQRNLKAINLELAHTEQVHTTRLDDYINRLALEHVPFVKLDVEGHEMAVLEGMGSYLDGSFIDFLAFEYGGACLDAHGSLAMLYDKMESAGFSVAKVMRRGLELRDYKRWMDNFTYSNYVAVSRKVLERVQPARLGLRG